MAFWSRKIKLPLEVHLFSAALSGGAGGLATTTALLAGLYVGTDRADIAVLTAVVSFCIHAFYNAVDQFSQERFDREVRTKTKNDDLMLPLRDALVQFGAHLAASMLTILPVAMIANQEEALILSISTTLLLLFLLGAYKARVLKRDIISDGVEEMTLGAGIIAVGLMAGLFIGG